jgi:hypothetical protein
MLSKSAAPTPMKTTLTVLQVRRMLPPYSQPVKGRNYAFFGQLQD